MFTRRDLVTGGALGALSAAAGAPVQAEQRDSETARAVNSVKVSLDNISDTLDTAFESNRLTFGFMVKIREYFTQFMRANFKFPDYMEVGMNVFYEVYDWHIKNNRQMEVSRVVENRMAIRYMFTLLILRPEQDANYVGVPFDR